MTPDFLGAGAVGLEERIVVAVESPAQNHAADASDAKAKAPKANAILGCMAALDGSN